jgi:hypothetical protein
VQVRIFFAYRAELTQDVRSAPASEFRDNTKPAQLIRASIGGLSARGTNPCFAALLNNLNIQAIGVFQVLAMFLWAQKLYPRSQGVFFRKLVKTCS